MEYFNGHSIEDLVFNKSFRNWVFSRNTPETDFWNHWVTGSPERSKLADDAKAIIYGLSIQFENLSDECFEDEIKHIVTRARVEHFPEKGVAEDTYSPKGIYSLVFWLNSGIAASIILAFVYVIYSFPASNVENTMKFESFFGKKDASSLENIQSGATNKRVLLPDGSHALLFPKSTLQFIHNFSTKERKIYLTGDVFFEVARDASRPFIVSTGTTLTKVLGTSFRIRSYLNDKTSLISVSSGKVSVFNAANNSEPATPDSTRSGVILTPNQEVIYYKDNNQLKKSLAQDPVALVKLSDNVFDFSATPIPKVFSALQETYGITIVYDSLLYKDCTLSARMGEASFYQKLEVICKVINSSYEIVDGSIVIMSGGCK